MTPKQRDVAFHHWSGEIRRETRDFASLDNIALRAMADADVRGDVELQSMIRGVIQQRRDEIDQNLRYDNVTTDPAPRPTVPSSKASITASRQPLPAVSAEHVRETFNRLALTLSASLERRDEDETQATFKTMQAFQQRNSVVIPGAVLAEYVQKIEKLRAHLKHLEDQIAPLTQRAVAASKNGNEQDLARATIRLTAIHAAHPTVLSEAGLEEIRRVVLGAAEEKQEYQATARKMLERQRAIAGEIKKLAATVHNFHEITCAYPGTCEEIRQAESAYLRTIQWVQVHDAAWFADVVLELADLLAEWTLPPLGAQAQIDRFLDSINLGLKNIRTEMRQIENDQNSDSHVQ